MDELLHNLRFLKIDSLEFYNSLVGLLCEPTYEDDNGRFYLMDDFKVWVREMKSEGAIVNCIIQIFDGRHLVIENDLYNIYVYELKATNIPFVERLPPIFACFGHYFILKRKSYSCTVGKYFGK
jgi:hypothetical protein